MDRVLLLNSFTFGGIGLAATLVPSRLGWALYHNEGPLLSYPASLDPDPSGLNLSLGCKYFQFHTRLFGVSALALATLNFGLSKPQTAKTTKITTTQVPSSHFLYFHRF